MLLDYGGLDLADSALARGGWFLQRFGGVLLDVDGGVGSFGLGDGEMVYLRAFADQILTGARR